MAERVEIEESRRLCEYEAVAHLANERVFIGLIEFDLAAGELPKQGQHGVLAALGDQIAAVLFNDGRYDANGAARTFVRHPDEIPADP